MPRIKQLPPHEAHKIAAGEVVERPANAVKELIENALDAGATQITVHIEQAGKKLIRIIDNGCGMDAQDARTCFDHHATSKISTIDDLTSIGTFGFRGEALSSIAAVSSVTLVTKQEEGLEGTKIELVAGTITHESIVSATRGTDISINNLFFNVPARYKFLRSDDTEWRQILLLFQAFCVDYHTIQFSLHHNGTLINHCPSAPDVLTRVAQLWDNTFAKNMIPLMVQQEKGTNISGVISNHHYARYDRSSIFFFVNKRWVKNQHLSRALLKGYMNVLPDGRFPAGCIFLDIDPAQVDINVHPRKEEVQFLHPRRCEQLVTETVKKSLEDHIRQRIRKEEPLIIPSKPFEAVSDLPQTQNHFVTPHEFIAAPAPMIFPMPTVQLDIEPTYDHQQTVVHATETDAHIVGYYNNTYILVEQTDGLYIVDQHAAHERILYEQFVSRFGTVSSTTLLFPEIISLSDADMKIIEPHLNVLQEHGIGIERLGTYELAIQSVPVQSKHVALEEFIREIVAWIHEHSFEPSQLHKKLNEHVHAQMACKAAVKAGDLLTQQQIEQLLRDLQTCNNRFTCPHGRPTGWLLPLLEIEKKFKRKK
jgi:DNA mismatch repair protein MutL